MARLSIREGIRARTAAALLALALGSCAAPLERTNRFFYAVNDVLDMAVMRPASEVYLGIVPAPARACVGNFFDNIAYPGVILNDFLQGKGRQGGADLGRFLANSTLGIGGLFDVAKRFGLPEHQEDLGQTLGVWGVGPGPYLVLPLLGPTTARDSLGFAFGGATTLLQFTAETDLAVPLQVLSALDRRARLKGAIEARDESAVDPYVFTREAYLQRREFLVHDGDPPTDYDEDLDALLDDLEEVEE